MDHQHSENKFAIGCGVTSACNMNCSFCYSSKRRTETTDIPISQWMGFFKRNSHKIENINFGTGENALVEGWFTLVDYIGSLNQNIGQGLTTNGTLVSRIGTSQKKDKIIKKNISDIDVSLDYSIEHKHNEFRGNNHAFKMANDTLEYCCKNGFNTTIVVMGIDDTLSIPNMSGIFDLASKYNAKVRVNIYRPVNKTSMDPPKLDTIIKLFDWIYENHTICSMSDPLFNSVFSRVETKEDPSGRRSLRILPDGSIYPSTYLISKDFCLGNINEENIIETISGSKVIQDLIGVIPNECKNCTVVKSCQGGTVDRRILWNGTLDKADPYCPKNFGYNPILRAYKIDSSEFSSIHEGYLPTFFFKPGVKIK